MATVPRRPRYYQGATTSCSARPSAYWFASRLRVAACQFVFAIALPSPRRLGAGPGSMLFTLAVPFQLISPTGQEQDLPGFLAPHPATLRRSTTRTTRHASPVAALPVLPSD